MLVAVNKVDSQGQEAATAEVYRLGMEPVLPVSAEHGRGVAELIEAVAMRLPAPSGGAVEEPGPLRIAVVGRPNVGKSSLVNAIAGQDRVVVDAQPGTTRDAVDTPVTVGGRPYVLVDTAGLRRKGRTVDVLDKLAAVMARRSLERADLALVVLDGSEGLATQDARIAGYAEAAGRAVVLVVNKWDLVGTADRAPAMVRTLRERLPFLAHAPVVFTSAHLRHGPRRAVRHDRPRRARLRQGSVDRRAEPRCSRPPWRGARREASTARRSRSSTARRRARARPRSCSSSTIRRRSTSPTSATS